MSEIGGLVERLVAAGLSVSDASEIIATAVAVGAATSIPRKSTSAIRQQRYRDRNKASRSLRSVTPDDTVTKRNESVTKRNDVTLHSIEVSKKEVGNEERKADRRATSLRNGWTPEPDDAAFATEQLGEACEVELQKFKDHALTKGRTCKNWNAAWRNWIRRAVEYRRGTNGQGTGGYRNGTAPSGQQSGAGAIFAGVAAAAGRRSRERGQTGMGEPETAADSSVDDLGLFPAEDRSTPH